MRKQDPIGRVRGAGACGILAFGVWVILQQSEVDSSRAARFLSDVGDFVGNHIVFFESKGRPEDDGSISIFTNILTKREALESSACLRDFKGILVFPVLMNSKIEARVFLSCLLAFGLAASPLPGAEPDIRRDSTVVAVERVMPCVVNIATETIVEYEDFYQRLFRDFFGQNGPTTRQQREFSVGSGVIIDEEGYVLTNLHVVRRANRTQVKLWDGREYEAVPIVATTHSDVALLKIQGKPGEKFKAVRLAPDDDLLLGETVLALGNPFGLGGSVTKGILSSKSRRPATGNEPLDVNDWLQTDAAINPGNSGGPLINIHGDLIGLNVAVYKEGQGIGFAIPVSQVSEALASFFSPEVRHMLWFGARLKAAPAPLTVADVQPASPAGKAGLQVGDRIMQINGAPADGLINFGELVSKAADNKVTLTVTRKNERKTFSLRAVPFAEMIHQKTGLTLTEMNGDQARRLGLQAGKGLLIDAVEKNSPAEKAELRKGFLITEIEGQSIENLMNAGVLLSLYDKGQQIKLTVVAPRRLGTGYVEFRQGTVDLPLR